MREFVGGYGTQNHDSSATGIAKASRFRHLQSPGAGCVKTQLYLYHLQWYIYLQR